MFISLLLSGSAGGFDGVEGVRHILGLQPGDLIAGLALMVALASLALSILTRRDARIQGQVPKFYTRYEWATRKLLYDHQKRGMLGKGYEIRMELRVRNPSVHTFEVKRISCEPYLLMAGIDFEAEIGYGAVKPAGMRQRHRIDSGKEGIMHLTSALLCRDEKALNKADEFPPMVVTVEIVRHGEKHKEEKYTIKVPVEPERITDS
ncbi:hypothetical protein [Pseudoxanthomonas mexicana]